MSYRYSALMINENKEKTLDALKGYLEQHGGSLEKAAREDGYGSDDPDYLAVAEMNGWTYLVFSGAGLIPEMEIALSRNLGVKAKGLDKLETLGYEHYNELDSGNAKIVYTNLDGIQDNVGVDWDGLKKFVQSKLPGAMESDYENQAFEYLQGLSSDRGLEEDVLANYESSEEWYRLECEGLEEKRMGSELGLFWKDLVSAS